MDPSHAMNLAAYVAAIVSLCAVAYTVVYGVYNVYLHPLRNFPGPAWYAMSRIPFLYHGLSGDRHRMALRLHQKYGPVVRSAPNELLFNSTEAWKDIMGHKVDGEEFPKNPILYQSGRTPDRSDIIWSSREEHARLRRQLAHGFSEKSMREQEPRIQQYIDLLIRRIHEKGNSGQTALQMDAWYNFTTFDIIGELAFGESFGCLQNSEYHEWVKCIFLSTKMVTYLQIEHCYPFMERFVTRFLLPLQLFRSLALHKSHNKDKLRERIANGPRNDLIEGLLKKQEELKMSMDDLEHNSGVLVVAGSETTATLLSVVTHLLTANPQALARLTDEVRGAFDREDDITFTSASRLPYMLACLNEALRMHTPFPNALPRTSPKGGAVVAGHVVPEDTIVGIAHWAVYHMEDNFKLPFEFHPERFLGDARFADDNRQSFQPFNIGPRNCIGKNLAYAEMRLILARIIFNFDMRPSPENEGWLDQRSFGLWEIKPLMMHMTPRADLKAR